MANTAPQTQPRGLLARINNLGWVSWFIIVTLIMYWVWNPVDMLPSAYKIALNDSVSIPLRLLTVAFTGVLIWLIYGATKGAIGHVGVAIMLVLIGLIIWAIASQGWMNVANVNIWQWLVQPIVGIIGATGIYWPRFKRAASGTGTITQTNTEVVVEEGHHGHQ